MPRYHEREGPPTCCDCHVFLTENNWPLNRRNQNKWQCKPCAKAFESARWKIYNAKQAPYKKEWYKKNLKRHILKRAKGRSKEQNVPFNLTEEDIIIPEICPVLGIKIEVGEGSKPSPNSPTLDKLIPEKGYVKGNVNIISHKANTIKNDATLEELEKVTSWLKNQLEKNE